jgi:hypothetical protein
MGRKSLVAAALVLGVTYLSSPYAALYHLSQDLQAGDVDAVRGDVDWDQVRAALKQDVAAQITGVKVTAVAQRNELPPFGASFVQGVASHVVDQAVTPEALCAAMHGPGAGHMHMGGQGWGMFDGPASFVAHLRSAASPQPITLRMRLEGAQWKVTSVHFDDQPQSRT